MKNIFASINLVDCSGVCQFKYKIAFKTNNLKSLYFKTDSNELVYEWACIPHVLPKFSHGFVSVIQYIRYKPTKLQNLNYKIIFNSKFLECLYKIFSKISYKNKITPQLFDGNGELFDKYIKLASLYCEYGPGYSTQYALTNTSINVLSIETNPVFYEITNILNSEFKNRLQLKYFDFGVVGDWGYPEKFSLSKSREYVYSAPLQGVDFLLIDARFRLAIFYRACLELREDCIICFDDFYNREYYQPALDILTPIDCNDRQAIFKTRNLSKDVKNVVFKLLEEALCDPR